MRIIAGSRKGARIQAPKGLATRPTGDRAREAAFNLIGPVDGARVLDLYAGSGAMGLEALSRGAQDVLFVEADREACRTIDRNLEKLGLDAARFESDLDSDEVKNKVENDRQSGLRSKVNSTPTFFLNGQKIQNPRSYDEFKSFISDALAK